ncbi:hypothetical protein LTR85_000048 [Meristemomyces frigidus]|nr:hypothetical protein LTR85_000048 [Meristemomyces frigidus]
MAENLVTDRYRRYKAGTKKVVEWLTSTAKRCEPISSLLSCASLSDNAMSESTQEELRVRDLLRLAEAIAASTAPKIDIPLVIIVVTEDVIDGRQACADWYSATKSGSNGVIGKQNHGHRNFIDVLKRILEVLKGRYEERLPKRQKQKPEKLRQMKEEVLRNIYDHLEVEQPSNAPLGSRRNTSTAKILSRDERRSAQVPVADLEEGDKTFALWCFFKDQHEVCMFIKEVWVSYVKGDVSLPTVCNVTDYAFMLMQKASAALVEQYPCFADMQDINDYLGFNLMTLGGGLTVMVFREKKVNADARSEPALHDLFCVKAFCVMQDFREMVCLSVDGVPPEARNVSNLFTSALYSLVPEIKLLAACDLLEGDVENHVPVVHEDRFLLGLINLAKSTKLPPWLVIACQAYMHIYAIIGLHHTEGFEVLHKDGFRLKQTLTDHLEYMSTSHQNSAWPCIMKAGTDFFLSGIKEEMTKTASILELRGPSPAFRMQKVLPMTCGSLLFSTQQSAHIIGVMDCNAGFIMLATAHIYRAARLCGALDADWPDMERFIAQHSAGLHQFVLENTKSATPLTTAARHYAIALGVKPSTTLTFKRYTRRDQATPTFQYADVPPVKHSLQHGRVLDASNCSPYMQHMVAESTKNSSYRKGESPWSSLQELVLHKVAYAALEKRAAEEEASGARLPPSQKRGAKLTAVQLLSAFKDMLKADELNFAFDYCRFLRECSDLMTAVLTRFGVAVKIDAFTPYRFVNIMLWEAAATEKKAPASPKLAETMLYQSASLIYDHVQRTGSSNLEAARTAFSGGGLSSSKSTPGDPNMKDILDMTIKASPFIPEAQPLTELIMLAFPEHAPDRRAIRGQKPYLKLDPKLFEELGQALQQELGIDFHMDSSTNIMSLFWPKAKDRREVFAFWNDLLGLASSRVRRVSAKPSSSRTTRVRWACLRVMGASDVGWRESSASPCLPRDRPENLPVLARVVAGGK